MALRRPRILVVGSFIMDLISTAARVPNMGETVIGTSFRTAPGGKGANQAVQCARLGADVTMVGCVGDDAFGKQLTNTVMSSGADVSRVKTSAARSSGVGIIELETGDAGVQNRILVIPSANYDLTPDDLSWLPDSVADYDMVMLQLEMRMDVTKYAARCAFSHGVPVMLNPAPAAALDSDLLECVTYLSPNEHEAAPMSGLPLKPDACGINDDDLRLVADKICSDGVGGLIITLGENGSALCKRGKPPKRTPGMSVRDVVDPTAAGDSFVAAFCTGITAGLDESSAMELASHTAALTVCGMGAMPSLPDIAAVQRFMMERGYDRFDPSELDVLKRA